MTARLLQDGGQVLDDRHTSITGQLNRSMGPNQKETFGIFLLDRLPDL